MDGLPSKHHRREVSHAVPAIGCRGRRHRRSPHSQEVLCAVGPAHGRPPAAHRVRPDVGRSARHGQEGHEQLLLRPDSGPHQSPAVPRRGSGHEHHGRGRLCRVHGQDRRHEGARERLYEAPLHDPRTVRPARRRLSARPASQRLHSVGHRPRHAADGDALSAARRRGRLPPVGRGRDRDGLLSRPRSRLGQHAPCRRAT